MDCKRFGLVLSAFFLIFSFTSTRVFAQTTTTGDMAGTVTDPSGAVVPDASVTIKDVGRGSSQDTKTDKDGIYRFHLLLPGPYTVNVSATGFKAYSQPTKVDVGAVTTVNIQLELGVATQVVEVSAQGGALIQTESGNVSSTISESQAANIPNPGNDITYVAQIAPGVVMSTQEGYGNFSAFGMSAVSNLFTLNGMDDNDPFLNLNNSGATNLLLGQNEIQEVSVVTNGYSGEYGGLAGANINYITRSGTDSFHGRTTWYWNGRYLNANNWFNNATNTPRPFTNANQYGGDIGGPIKRDKMFFYFNAEGLYMVIPTSESVNLPSSAFVTAAEANINALYGAGSQISKFYQNMFTLYAGAPGASRATNTLPDMGCDGSPLPAVFGTTEPCALTYFSTATGKTHENLQAGRFDWNVTKNDRFFFRVQHDIGLQATYTDPINSLFNGQSTQPEWQGQAQLVHSFASGAANQLIVAGQFYSAIFTNADRSQSLAAFPTTLTFPSGTVGQFYPMGWDLLDWPEGRRVTQFQVSDDYTKPMGVHTLKVGAKYRRNWTTNLDYGILSSAEVVPFTLDSLFWGGTDPRPGNIPGTTTPYSSNTTFFDQAFPQYGELPFVQYTLGGYVEDDWKVRPNLTLTLAFRLDHPSNLVCSTDCFPLSTVPFPFLSTDPTTPYNQLITVGQKRMLFHLTDLEPQPRFGFAWQPHFWGMHDTVIRGGIGIFYDNFPGALVDAISENPPNEPTFGFTSATSTISYPTDAASYFATAATTNAAFLAGFKSGGSFSSISAAVPTFTPPALAGNPSKSYAPSYEKWNLSVERSFGADTVVGIQYVGNHGYHIFFDNGGINAWNGTGTFVGLPATVPNPSFSYVQYGLSDGTASYNGVTASLTHRYKSGQVQINYSYSHTIDTVSNSGILPMYVGPAAISILGPEDPAHPKKYNTGNADQDVRHSLNANYIWELPIKHYVTRDHGPDRLLKGWDVNGAVFLRSGFPFTLVDTATTSALTSYNYGVLGAYGPFVFGNQLVPGEGTSQNCRSTFPGVPQPSEDICLAPSAFSTSPNGFGNVARNTIRGPSYWDSDFSLMKHTKVFKERAEFVIGAQMYNVFNHPNFDVPIMDTGNLRFGQVVRLVSPPTTMYGSFLGADSSPRLVQLKLQFNF